MNAVEIYNQLNRAIVGITLLREREAYLKETKDLYANEVISVINLFLSEFDNSGDELIEILNLLDRDYENNEDMVAEFKRNELLSVYFKTQQ